jgi:uncharacterized RDD family membrane protein YckC
MSDNATPPNTQSNQIQSANPYAAPGSNLSTQNAGEELAGRGRRLGAAFIDGIIMIFVTAFPIVWMHGGFGNYMAKAQDPSIGFLLSSVVFGFVMYLVVNGYFLAKDGQTIGKKLLGTRIVRTDGSKADFMRIVLRRLLPVQIASAIPMIGGLLVLIDVLLIFRGSKKCVHDDIADTIVIRVA